ncbi:MAG TPA: hypothetical protein VH988_31630 [Thermoanaerobaculia bacterium]|jgi:hypothetical protein|nr:hypothetical protein [Thermoanaerobaculia bacterium]
MAGEMERTWVFKDAVNFVGVQYSSLVIYNDSTVGLMLMGKKDFADPGTHLGQSSYITPDLRIRTTTISATGETYHLEICLTEPFEGTKRCIFCTVLHDTAATPLQPVGAWVSDPQG